LGAEKKRKKENILSLVVNSRELQKELKGSWLETGKEKREKRERFRGSTIKAISRAWEKDTRSKDSGSILFGQKADLQEKGV